MSLRDEPALETVALPDGREAVVRVGVPDDSYVGADELDTVSLEVTADGETIVALNTVLDAAQEDEARALAREVASGLESGELEPSAGALEPLAETRPAR